MRHIEPTGKYLVIDIAKRMNRIMKTHLALKGSVAITGDDFARMDDRDFSILWYMPVVIVTEKQVLKEMHKRADSLGLMKIRQTKVNDKVQLN